MKFNKNFLIGSIIVILLLAVIYLSAVLFFEKKNQNDSQFAVEKAIEYIKKSSDSKDATLIGINPNKFKLKDMYEFVIETNGSKYSLFVTSDGKYLIFPNSIVDITAPTSNSNTNATPQEKGAENTELNNK